MTVLGHRGRPTLASSILDVQQRSAEFSARFPRRSPALKEPVPPIIDTSGFKFCSRRPRLRSTWFAPITAGSVITDLVQALSSPICGPHGASMPKDYLMVATAAFRNESLLRRTPRRPQSALAHGPASRAEDRGSWRDYGATASGVRRNRIRDHRPAAGDGLYRRLRNLGRLQQSPARPRALPALRRRRASTQQAERRHRNSLDDMQDVAKERPGALRK